MILITGATGFIGRHLTHELMKQGVPIRCLLQSHRLKKIPWDTHGSVAPEIVVGTLLEEESVFRAMNGVHTVVHLESAQWWGRARDFERIDVAGTRNIITQARAARVGRILYLSQLGASPSSAYTLIRSKGQVEEMVRNSGLAYTIIRSGLVFGEDDSFINHIAMMLSFNPFFFLMPGRGEVVLHPIYIDDLVTALVHSLETIGVIDQTVEIGGPEYTTLEELLLTVMRVTGMYRPIIAVPPYFLRWTTGVFSRILPRSVMTSQWLDLLATNRSTKLGNTYEYFRFRPRRFEDTLLTYMPNRHYLLPLIRYSFRRRPRGI